MARGIANPTIQWNGQTIEIIPNSVEYKNGLGDKNIRAISAGGNAISTVITENAETKISMIKFAMANTAKYADIARQMSELVDQNELLIISNDLQVTFSGMALETEPTIPLTQDGEIEVSFMGAPSTSSPAV